MHTYGHDYNSYNIILAFYVSYNVPFEEMSRMLINVMSTLNLRRYRYAIALHTKCGLIAVIACRYLKVETECEPQFLTTAAFDDSAPGQAIANMNCLVQLLFKLKAFVLDLENTNKIMGVGNLLAKSAIVNHSTEWTLSRV